MVRFYAFGTVFRKISLKSDTRRLSFVVSWGGVRVPSAPGPYGYASCAFVVQLVVQHRSTTSRSKWSLAFSRASVMLYTSNKQPRVRGVWMNESVPGGSVSGQLIGPYAGLLFISMCWLIQQHIMACLLVGGGRRFEANGETEAEFRRCCCLAYTRNSMSSWLKIQWYSSS